MRDKYGAENDRHCSPGSQTLINKLNITDEDTLYAAEAEIVLARAEELNLGSKN